MEIFKGLGLVCIPSDKGNTCFFQATQGIINLALLLILTFSVSYFIGSANLNLRFVSGFWTLRRDDSFSTRCSGWGKQVSLWYLLVGRFFIQLTLPLRSIQFSGFLLYIYFLSWAFSFSSCEFWYACKWVFARSNACACLNQDFVSWYVLFHFA